MLLPLRIPPREGMAGWLLSRSVARGVRRANGGKGRSTLRAVSGDADKDKKQRQGANKARVVPEGDDKERLQCMDCLEIFYENPKVVVGAVPIIPGEGRVLLCERALQPMEGKWGFPQGYLEMGESVQEGAKREAWEEANAHLRIRSLLSVFNLPAGGQVQLIYLADLLNPSSVFAGAFCLALSPSILSRCEVS